MERFEMNNETGLELFANFVGKAKDALVTLGDNIKNNIKMYEEAIENTEKSIQENDTSREKCEHEISKMESKIDSIKETIENVESTYKKIVDAYSTTSKGETKDLYSDIIDGAKANCEKDVEKNRTEIARLNSDIEAIKNNIVEFSRIGETLSKDLEAYKLELEKYNKANTYLESVNDDMSSGLNEIMESKVEKVKATPKKATPKRNTVKEEKPKEEKREVKIDFSEPELEVVKEDVHPEVIQEIENDIDDSLQRIYDLTGYKPDKKEEIKEEPKEELKEEKPVYKDNLENLFANAGLEDIKVETTEPEKYSENDMSEWENILNGGANLLDFDTPTEKKEESKRTIQESVEDTVDQLLKPYGTSYPRLKSLISDKIVHKDGSVLNVEVSAEDIIAAINAIDGTDLKAMKTVGPEITLLRKVKSAKEGAR